MRDRLSLHSIQLPDRLSVRSILLLVALAFGLALAIQAVQGGDSSAARPAAEQSVQGFVSETPAAQPDLRLVSTGTVPALRRPRRPHTRRRHTRTRPPVRRVLVKAAPKLRAAPVVPAAPARPAPTAAPRYVPPAPRYVPPAPRPKPSAPKPAPAPPTAPSGEFDTSGS